MGFEEGACVQALEAGIRSGLQVALGAKNIAELKDYSFPFYVIEKAKIPSLPIDVFHTVRSLLRAYV
jgi:hypothetical protein